MLSEHADGRPQNQANAFGLSSLNSAVGTNTAVNAFGQAVQSFVPTPPGAGLYQVLGSDFQATVRAIAQAGKTEVLSRPSILARNNQQATITVGQSVPLVTSVSYNGLNGTPVSAISYQSVGIILRVTPFINSSGMVEMIVSPQISQLSDQSVTVSAGVSAPVIDLRSADTVVVTPDGQTVIIGGLMQNQKTQTDSKVPLLGDIPLLGNLFKRRVKANTKTELMIFLTPHVVYEPAQLASLSTTERGNAEMAPKAFSEEELNRYLDTLPVKDSQPPKKAGLHEHAALLCNDDPSNTARVRIAVRRVVPDRCVAGRGASSCASVRASRGDRSLQVYRGYYQQCDRFRIVQRNSVSGPPRIGAESARKTG